jgi:hypothetical protein
MKMMKCLFDEMKMANAQVPCRRVTLTASLNLIKEEEMKPVTKLRSGLFIILFVLTAASGVAEGQTTQITTEYLMTVYVPLDPPQVIDKTLFIYNVREGGWFKGPKIGGKVIAPSADWERVMPGGNYRLDVRATLKTEDGALVYIAYNGIVSLSKESFDRLMKGETLTSKELYFIAAPTMETSSDKYAWLNHVQCVYKIAEMKMGESAFVKYDLFIVR